MSLQHLFHVLFVRQRTIVLVVFCAAFAAVVLVTFTRQDEYDASATLFVGENRPVTTGATAVQLDEVLAQTYAELLDTGAVAREVARDLPFPATAEDLAGDFTFEVLTGTNLIEITATADDPQRAAALANGYANSFVRRQAASAGEDNRETIERLNGRIAVLAQEIAALGDGGSRPGAFAQAQVELDALQNSYEATQENVALQASTLAVSAEAIVPSAPARPRTKLMLAVGLILAALAAVGAGLLRNLFDKRLRDEAELIELLGLQILARIPIRPETGTVQNFDESLQFLSANLQLQHPEVRIIAVSSPVPSDGKTTVVVGLGRALARTGGEVVAVDCDLRRPRLASTLGRNADRGVTNVLVASAEPLELVLQTAEPGLGVLPTGPLPPNPAVLLGTATFGHMTERLRDNFDYVLVDTPPVTVGAETSDAASRVDGVVLVVDIAQSNRDALVATRDQLGRAGARMLGVVLNRSGDERGSAYAGYYGEDTSPGADGRSAVRAAG